MNKKMLSLAAFALAAMSFMSSCKDDDDDKKDTPAPAGNANVLLVHASPDAPLVDILVDNAVVVDSVAYLDNTLIYLPVTAGTRNIKLNATGLGINAFNADVTFTKDKNYSVFACDSLSALTAVVLEDDLTAPAAGKAHVRFVHLSPNAPAVDVAPVGGAALFKNYEFKEASPFTPLNAGTYDLEVRLTSDTTQTVLDLPGVSLTAGKIYTVYARGFVTGIGVQALGASVITNN